MISNLILCIGASVTVGWGGAYPCETAAKLWNAPYEIVGYAGSKIGNIMPADSKIENAAVLIVIDGFYWYNGFKSDCDEAKEVANKLFILRKNKPFILATIPWNSGCASELNPILEKQCIDYCILVKLEGDLEPKEWHPGPEFTKKVIKHIYKRQL
jgi:hypothetical protein